MDAHSLYLSVMALHVRDRPAYLTQTPYASLPQQTLKKMVMEPKEGVVRKRFSLFVLNDYEEVTLIVNTFCYICKVQLKLEPLGVNTLQRFNTRLHGRDDKSD